MVKDTLKKVLSFLLIIMMLLLPISSFADITDPYHFESYASIGEGAQFNYHEGVKGQLSANITYRVFKTAGGVISGAALTSPYIVCPGDALEIEYTIGFKYGYGDGEAGTDSIKDLLFIAKDESETSILAKYPTITIPDVGTPSAIDSLVDAVEVGVGTAIVVTGAYVVAGDASDGKTIKLPYALFDYGYFLVDVGKSGDNSEVSAYSPNQQMNGSGQNCDQPEHVNKWLQTKSVDGFIPLEVDVPETPILIITKSAISTAPINTAVTYTVEVASTADHNVPDIHLEDSRYGNLASIPVLTSGAVYTTTYVLTMPGDAGPYVNVVTASAVNSDTKTDDQSIIAPVSATWTVNVTKPQPIPDPNPRPAPTPDKVTLTVTIIGEGTVVPGTGSYDRNSEVIMTPTATGSIAGNAFLHWEGIDVLDVVGNKITMNTSKSIIAHFGAPPLAPLPAPPAMITVIPEPVPEAVPAPVVEEEVPQAAPALPRTAGIPLELFGLLATGMLGMGLMLRKKEK